MLRTAVKFNKIAMVTRKELEIALEADKTLNGSIEFILILSKSLFIPTQFAPLDPSRHLLIIVAFVRRTILPQSSMST